MNLRLGMIPIWPSWEDVKKSMPPAFQRRYPDTFIIIDATELPVEKPSTLALQSQLYSMYKSHCTVKGLVGITPSGMFTFISQLYTGSISDRQLVIDSGVLPNGATGLFDDRGSHGIPTGVIFGLGGGLAGSGTLRRWYVSMLPKGTDPKSLEAWNTVCGRKPFMGQPFSRDSRKRSIRSVCKGKIP